MRTTWVAASAFIKNGEQALIVRRSDQDDFLPGYWELVGGKLEWGEPPEDGVAREAKEESGLEVKPVKIYHAHHHINKAKERYIVEINYVCQIVGSDSVTLSHEHSEYKWIREEELQSIEPMSGKMRSVIQKGFSVT